MAQVFGGKRVTHMRHLEPGDKDYKEDTPQVEITTEDGKPQVVKTSEVKSSDPAPKPEAQEKSAVKMPLDDEDEKPSLGSRRK